MTVVYLELAGLNIHDSPDSFPVAHWDGYTPSLIPQAFSQGTANGTNASWGDTVLTGTLNSLTNIPYIGYTTNFAASNEARFVTFSSVPYIGYNTNFGGTFYNNVSEVPTTDIDSVIEYPKTQFVYFKLKGYNPNTHSYEVWIIEEDITSRPELFDPGRHVPSVERDLFKGPPSGHALVNITIVARWIQ